jgi:YhcH/YjgK/YiaL family protein
MISDTSANALGYASLHAGIAHAVAWLTTFDPTTPDGNHDIGHGCEARVMSYRTEPAEQRRWESHRRFIDVQWIMSGVERIDVAPLAMLAGATPYDASDDVLFYAHATAPVSAVVLRSGEFAIFFPTDGHRPATTAVEPTAVRKVVVKVPI